MPLAEDDLIIFDNKIKNAITWEIIVATPIPVIPIAGIKPYPNINNGFKKMFKIKLKIKTFLKVFVSPSACKREFNATTLIKTTEPEKITLVYWRPKLITSLLDPL